MHYTHPNQVGVEPVCQIEQPVKQAVESRNTKSKGINTGVEQDQQKEENRGYKTVSQSVIR